MMEMSNSLNEGVECYPVYLTDKENNLAGYVRIKEDGTLVFGGDIEKAIKSFRRLIECLPKEDVKAIKKKGGNLVSN